MTVLLPEGPARSHVGRLRTPFRIERPGGEAGPTGTIYCDPLNVPEALELLFAAFNRGSGQEVEFTGPSLSVGDRVHLGETTWVCAPVGWEVDR